MTTNTRPETNLAFLMREQHTRDALAVYAEMREMDYEAGTQLADEVLTVFGWRRCTDAQTMASEMRAMGLHVEIVDCEFALAHPGLDD